MFLHQDDGPRNGSPASSVLPSRIGANQNWLASRDVDMHNFISHPICSQTAPPGGRLKLLLFVPPFVQWVEFLFMAAGDTASSDPRITLACSDTSDTVSSTVKTHAMSAVADNYFLTASGVATLIPFRGGYSTAISGYDFDDGGPLTTTQSSNTARALKVVSSQLDYWTQVEVQVTLSADVIVLSGAYFFVPVRKATVP